MAKAMNMDEQIAQMKSKIEEMEKEISALEAKEEITVLNSLYGFYCDEGVCGNMDAWVQLMDRWVDDAVGKWTGLGTFEGKEAIHAFYRDTPVGIFSVHMKHSGIIEVEGDKATATWYLTSPYINLEHNTCWVAGKYEEEYIKVDGVWKWSYVFGDLMYFTPFDQGWAKKPW